MNFMKMRTFYKKLPLFIKKSILHTYKKTQTSNMSFIKNSIFGTFRDPWEREKLGAETRTEKGGREDGC